MDFYPNLPIVIFDNGSRDDSINFINNISEKHSNICPYFHDKNIFHGPALDFALQHLITSKYCFILDSDTRTFKGGFLEEMKAILEGHEKYYAIGQLESVNRRGFVDTNGKIKVVLTPYCLIKREIYVMLHPFIHHGMPTIYNYHDAAKGGYEIFNYPIDKYIYHSNAGTASRFGYGLGIMSKIDYVIEKLFYPKTSRITIVRNIIRKLLKRIFRS